VSTFQVDSRKPEVQTAILSLQIHMPFQRRNGVTNQAANTQLKFMFWQVA